MPPTMILISNTGRLFPPWRLIATSFAIRPIFQFLLHVLLRTQLYCVRSAFSAITFSTSASNNTTLPAIAICTTGERSLC